MAGNPEKENFLPGNQDLFAGKAATLPAAGSVQGVFDSSVRYGNIFHSPPQESLLKGQGLILFTMNHKDLLKSVRGKGGNEFQEIVLVGVSAEMLHGFDSAFDWMLLTEDSDNLLPVHQFPGQSMLSRIADQQYSIVGVSDVIAEMVENPAGFSHA